jgi:hypothetical protein
VGQQVKITGNPTFDGVYSVGAVYPGGSSTTLVQILVGVAFASSATFALGGQISPANPGASYGSAYGQGTLDQWVALPSVNATVTQAVIPGVIDGAKYMVQIRSVNAGGVPGDWVEAGPVVADGARDTLPLKPYQLQSNWRPSTYSMGLSQLPPQSGNPIVQINAWRPINQFSPTLGTPVIDDNAIVSTMTASPPPTLGIEPGNWYAVVCGIDANGLYSQPSNVTQFSVPTGVFYQQAQFTANFTGNLAAYEIFAGPDPINLFGQGPVSVSSPIPTSIVINYINPVGYGVPDARFDHFHIRAAQEVAGVMVTSVSLPPSNTLLNLQLNNGSLSSGQFNGYKMFLASLASLGPVGNYEFIINATSTVGQLTFTSPEAGFFHQGDTVVIRALADTHTPTTIGCSNYVNTLNPAGLPVNAYKGWDLVLTEGTGAGQVIEIESNTSTVITTATAMFPVPDSTTQFVLRSKTWAVDVQTASQVVFTGPSPSTAAGSAPVISVFPAASLSNQMVFVEVLPSDINNNDAPFNTDEFAEIYIQAAPSVDGVSIGSITLSH